MNTATRSAWSHQFEAAHAIAEVAGEPGEETVSFASFMALHKLAGKARLACNELSGDTAQHTLTINQNAMDALDMASVLFNLYQVTADPKLSAIAWRWLAIAGHLFTIDIDDIDDCLPVQDEELWNSYYCEDLTDHAHGWRCAESIECPNCEGIHCSASLRCECGTWLTLSKVA